MGLYGTREERGAEMGKAKDMTGKKMGRLKVLTRVENDKYGNAMWLCLCDCGNRVIVKGHHLRTGKTQSCGCYHKDRLKTMNLEHGYSGTPLYKSWHAMKTRCVNKNSQSFRDYGGRGITFCKEWLGPRKFIDWALENGYDENLTLERIDVNGDYTPENCTWVTRAEQNRNTRRNIKQKINGKEYTLSEIATKLGVTRGTVYAWYNKEGLRGEELIKRYAKVPERYKNTAM